MIIGLDAEIAQKEKEIQSLKIQIVIDAKKINTKQVLSLLSCNYDILSQLYRKKSESLDQQEQPTQHKSYF